MADGTRVGNAYVEVTPKAAGNFASVLDKQLGDGDAKGKTFGSALSGGMQGMLSAGAVAMGNILSDVVQSGVGAVRDLVGDSFNGFSQFEQLSGGMEKIFDQADTSKIMADASAAYSDLNMSANEYLESINQVGAAFAQTMGDQAGYDTARQGMLAIADYASGTGRNLDELNEKYSLITRSTGSYQSIADQFSGILPATSKDFLEQAKAAGFLSDSYEQLTDVPVAEYQQAVTQMLEKGVADMGLAGNTAKESTETVAGSMAMAQSAWENWVASLGNPDADMTGPTDALIESLGAVAENALPVVENVVSTLSAELPGLVATIGPVLIPSVVSMVASVAPAVVGLLPTLLQAGMQLFLGLVQASTVVLPQLAQTVIAAGPSIYLAALEMFRGLGTALGEIAPMVIDGVVYLITHLPEIIVGGIAAMMDAGGQLFFGFIEGITGKELPAAETAGSMAAAATEAAAANSDASAAGQNLTDTFASSFDFSAVEASAMQGAQAATDAAVEGADGTAIADQLAQTTSGSIDVAAMDPKAAEMVEHAVSAAKAVDVSSIGAEFSQKAAGGIDTSAMLFFH